jgi:hypothetical protein
MRAIKPEEHLAMIAGDKPSVDIWKICVEEILGHR